MPEPDAFRLAAVYKDARHPERGQKRYPPVHLLRILSFPCENGHGWQAAEVPGPQMHWRLLRRTELGRKRAAFPVSNIDFRNLTLEGLCASHPGALRREVLGKFNATAFAADAS